MWGERRWDGHFGGLDRSLVKLISIGFGRAQRLDGIVAVTYLALSKQCYHVLSSHQAGGVALLLRNSVHLYQTEHQGAGLLYQGKVMT